MALSFPNLEEHPLGQVIPVDSYLTFLGMREALVKISIKFCIVAAFLSVCLALQALPPLQPSAGAAEAKAKKPQQATIVPKGGSMERLDSPPKDVPKELSEALDELRREKAPKIDKEPPRPKDKDLPAKPNLSDPEAAALSRARESGKRVEIVAKRSETEMTWANPQGTLSTEISSGPVRVKKGSDLVPVDTTLELGIDSVSPKAVPDEIKLSKGGANTVLASMVVNGSNAKLHWPGELPAPTLEGNTATYRDIAPGQDLVLKVTTSGVKTFVVLKERPAVAPEITLPISLEGLRLQNDEGGKLKMVDGKGEVQLSSPTPVMWSAARDAASGEPTQLRTVDTQIEDGPQGQTVTLRPDPGFVLDPATVYPLTIDPVLTSNASLDTYVSSAAPTSSYDADVELKVGTPDHGASKYRSFVRFNTTILSGRQVHSAILSLHQNWSYTCFNSSMYVDGAAAFGANTTWNTQPAIDARHYSIGSWAGGGNSACPATGGWKYVEIGDLARVWASTPGVYDYLTLHATSETNSYNWRKFASANSATPPSITVEYDPQAVPGAPRDVRATPLNGGAYVSWVPAYYTPVNGYGVFTYKWNGSAWDLVSGELASINEQGKQITGLVNGETYITFVFTYNANGWGGAMATSTYVPAVPPTTPANVVATAADGAATVRWSPSTTGGGATIAQYAVASAPVGDSTVPSAYVVVCGTCTSTTFGAHNASNGLPLQNGKKYLFAVVAVNSSGQASSSPIFGASNTVTPGASDPMSGAGSRSRFTTDSYSLSDRIAFDVNIATGNLHVSATDFALPMIGGGSMSIGREYNSATVAPGASAPYSNLFGYGWRSNLSPDMRLVPLGNGHVQLHDASGNVSAFTPNGSAFTTPPGVDADLTKQTNGEYTLLYHSSQQKLVFNPAGDLTSSADRNGNTVSFSYPDGRRPATLTSTSGANPGNQVAITYAGPGGRLDKIAQAATPDTPARSTTFIYSGTANGLWKVVDSEDGVTEFLYDGSSRLSQITDPEGHVVQFDYDTSHRVTKVTQKIPSETDAVTAYDYTTPGVTKVTDPNLNPPVEYSIVGESVTQVRDAFGRMSETGWAGVNDRVASGRKGRMVSGSAQWDPNANVGWMADNERLSSLADPMTSGGLLGYDGQYAPSDPRHWLPATSTDSMGRVTSLAYDAKGNYLSSTLAGATSSVTVNGDGTVATSTTPNNQASTNPTLYDYFSTGSGKGLLKKVTPPTGNSLAEEAMTYDGNGRLKTSTSGKGVITTYVYDKLDRIESLTFTTPPSEDPIPDIEFTYFADGRLKSREDGSGTTTYTYDEADRLKTKNPPGSPTISYGYDPAGNLSSSTDSGGTTTYRYNSANEMDKMTEPSGRTDLFTYNYLGLRSDTWYGTSGGGTYSNGAMAAPSSFIAHIKTDYDMAGNLTHIQTAGKSVAGGGDGPLLSSLDYSFTIPEANPCAYPVTPPAGGTMTSIRHSVTDNLTSKTTTWCYDERGRLESADTPSVSSYSYGWDANTNRISDGAGTHMFNSGDQLSGSGYAYDADGNETASPAFPALGYNAIDQTESITALGQASVPMIYAGIGQSERIQHGLTTAQNGPMGVQTETSGGQTVSYVRDASGQLVYQDAATADFYYYFDGLGSVIGLIDATTGEKRARYSYDPFGDFATAEGVNGSLPANPWRWMGGYLDSTGLYHFGERYYEPATGRFLQVDPSQQEENSYAYAFGDPVNFSDLSGLKGSPFSPFWTSVASEGLGWIAYGGCVLAAGATTAGAATPLALVGCGVVQGVVAAGSSMVINESFSNGHDFAGGTAGTAFGQGCRYLSKGLIPDPVCAAAAAAAGVGGNTAAAAVDKRTQRKKGK
jgi:RHS repeat-associated protein